MGLIDSVASLFGDEWDRFTKGLATIADPGATREQDAQRGRLVQPGESRRITIPGWEDVIRLGPRYEPTKAEVDEFYAARRAGRAPNISPEAAESIISYRDFRDGVRRSAQDEYSKGWGQVLTALDNVQDFASTLSTFGRLALWPAMRVPALSQALALQSQLLALEGAATADVLRRRALIQAGLRLLPIGARVGARFVPVLGWVLLASDLLNLLSLTGMVASPLHALICNGPAGAMSAGLPTALFKRGLKQELWKAATSNPFGREARLRRRFKITNRLPGMGAALEVLQTTEQLFGWGVSFGAVVGMLAEIGAAPGRLWSGEGIEVRSRWERSLGTDEWREPFAPSSRPVSQVQESAARVLQHAPSIMATQDMFTTEQHILALVAHSAAASWLLPQLPHAADDDAVIAAMDIPIPVRLALSPAGEAINAFDGLDARDGARWPVPGSPALIPAGELVELLAPRIVAATRLFLERRRNTQEGVFAAAVIAQATEAMWFHYTGDVDAVAFRLAPDYQLLAGLAEDGWTIPPRQASERLWGFWGAARALVEGSDGRYPGFEALRALADAHGVALLRMLPPDAPIPPEWSAWTPEPATEPIPAALAHALRAAGAYLPVDPA